MHLGREWRLGNRPALDGIRGVAVLLVVAAHASLLPRSAGPAGVAMFFALSGFLITALLLEEHSRTGRLAFGSFYLRRAVRLLPALVVMLAVVLLVCALAGLPVPLWDVVSALTYWANWFQLDVGTGRGILVHTWSLSIEEQFYLAWPVVLLVLARRGRRAVVAGCLVGITASCVVKVLVWDGGLGANRVYFGTDTRFDGLLVGALAAALLVGSSRGSARRTAVATVLPVLVLGWAVLSLGWSWGTLAVTVVVPAATGLWIFLVVTRPAPSWLTTSALVAVGRRSYGLYLWHKPVLYVGYELLGRGWAQTALLLVVSAAVTEASWRLVEQPAQRWLRRRTTARSGAGVLTH